MSKKATVEDILIALMYDSVSKSFTSRSILQKCRIDCKGRASQFKLSTVQTGLRNLFKKGFLNRTRAHDDGGVGNEYVYTMTEAGMEYGWGGKPS